MELFSQVLAGAPPEVRAGYHGLLADLFSMGTASQSTSVNEVGGLKLLYHVVDSRQLASYLIKECNR